MRVRFKLRYGNGFHLRTENELRFVSRVRKSKTTTPILKFTVMDGEVYEAASLRAGADGFALKVFALLRLVGRQPVASGDSGTVRALSQHRIFRPA
jgi:DNA-binding response OmpR family regulator